MKIILFIINLTILLYGTSPIFTTNDALPEDRQGQVYIIVDYGICLDDFGNGVLYGYEENHNYISYSGVKNIKSGDKIYTFCIMNPNSKECDDIIGRIDVIEDSEQITVNMDGIIDYMITEYGLQLYFNDGTGYWWEW